MPHTRNELLSWAKDAWEKITGKHKEEEVTTKGWVARDKDGFLCLYTVKPWRIMGSNSWHTGTIPSDAKIPAKYFPSVQWSDPEPTPGEITIKIKK